MLLPLLASWLLQAADTSVPAAVTERVDAYLAPYAEAGHLSGTILLARDGDVVYERSFGMADVENEVPNTPETRFCVASVTKPMTVIAAIRLIEAGPLDAQSTLDAWIPDFPRADEITVAHLLNHRAGIPHRVTTDETLRRSAADMVELAMDADSIAEPGSASIYSSAGFSVLTRVLELASGKSYQELLRELVFQPAGMERSVDSWDLTADTDRARSYRWTATGILPTEPKDLTFLVGAGSVWSTPRDLFRLQQALREGRLGPSALANVDRGAGFHWNGVTHGFRAFADSDPQTGVQVIFTGNLMSGVNDWLKEDLPRLLAGEDIAPRSIPAYAPYAALESDLVSHVGSYQMRPGSLLDVTVGDGCLEINDWFLMPLSATEFFSPQDFGRITFPVSDSGKSMRWTTEYFEVDYPRVATPDSR